MAQGTTRIDKALTNISVQYKNNDLIAGQILKDINVTQDSGIYWVYNADFRLEETRKYNKSQANMVTWDASTSSYNVYKHALKDIITDEDRDNTDAPLMLDIDTTEYLTDKIQMRYEYDVANLLFTTGTWGNNVTLTTATSMKYNTTTSAPIQVVLSATGKIVRSSGKKANLIVSGLGVLEALKENPNVYNRIQYVERALLTADILASIFDVPQYLVGSAIYNPNKEGATASITTIWSDDMLIGYFDPSPGQKKVSAAVNFRVGRYGTPYSTYKWHDESIEGDYIEVRTKYSPQAVATACAFFIKSAAIA